ncbi:MAG: Re/Si-specific NAD(P)(+) transhydrogenase subunit alpha [Microbacteriaceae bacterium]|jgi:NAD(P) transhydrogenase subunit alpha|nr:Re/Si-specific NAD(P)(+) transhydrogenase subunit alpha [Microbacteriaceae bacterium]MBT5248241.1 Re/Si-specific NAD(P)(+) transhydrogenase subunit alpha [Microbacteriaceae bacterium]MBT5616755.1 Re/Si-specific NAD(P)(+) transhydrogenase subunit alpha [Microbacteriaceae bacterium]MBT5730210.1 Re/Si-specific NAD(P)(+) transhydrogenase subunit alpha [Microbacteriaceae bacterium]MBT7803052.1 Re/Si-specific NAD(P)(+) transhydrogenase subunit alpha [Microbacteriaceae bacterium]
MIVGVLKEPVSGEKRVAATPESVKQLVAAGLKVSFQKGAGVAAGYADDDYKAAGATVAASVDVAKVDVLAHVRPLAPATIKKLKKGTITMGLASPASEAAAVKALRDQGVTSFALELVPRISRAQSMDALTSQALVAGYRCVLEAGMRLPRFFPLYMTAAGTVPPATVLVLGAGVAGLQAIATAKRLGAKVNAYDVRSASADEVRSMGGTFIELDLDVAADGAGGYAKELAADRVARQQELLTPYVSAADVIITTAAIPGRPAPRLITATMMKDMKPGSVIIDLAAETGGNVEGSKPGVDVSVSVGKSGGAITLVGMKDVPSTMAYDASRLYAKNVANLLELMTKDKAVKPDFEDEVVAGACLTHAGEIRHQPTAEALAPASSAKKGTK